jgi:hypothetical protein
MPERGKTQTGNCPWWIANGTVEHACVTFPAHCRCGQELGHIQAGVSAAAAWATENAEQIVREIGVPLFQAMTATERER